MNKKKDEIKTKVDELEKTEQKSARQDKVKYGPGRRGVTVGVTVGACAVLVVGGYFLVGKLVDRSAENQTSNAPASSYDSGSFAPGGVSGSSGSADDNVSGGNSSDNSNNSSIAPDANNDSPNDGEIMTGADGLPIDAPDADPNSPASTSSRDTGALTDSGAGADPDEYDPSTPGWSGGSLIAPDFDNDIIPPSDGEITMPTTSGWNITVPTTGSYTDPDYTTSPSTSGTGSWTTAAPHTTAGTTKTPSTTKATTKSPSTSKATTKSTTESTTFSGNPALKPPTHIVIDGTFEGNIDDFFD